MRSVHNPRPAPDCGRRTGGSKSITATVGSITRGLGRLVPWPRKQQVRGQRPDDLLEDVVDHDDDRRSGHAEDIHDEEADAEILQTPEKNTADRTPSVNPQSRQNPALATRPTKRSPAVVSARRGSPVVARPVSTPATLAYTRTAIEARAPRSSWDAERAPSGTPPAGPHPLRR